MLESDVEDELSAGMAHLGGLYFKFRPFGIIGVPDRICLLPGGRLIFVELKKPRGVVKPWQKRMHDRLRELGFRVEVLFSIAEVRSLLLTL